MNTSGRSIALVNAAMRRRFAFEQLHPGGYPVRGLLDRWLREHGHGDEAARLLDELNTRIDGPDSVHQVLMVLMVLIGPARTRRRRAG